MHALIQYQSRMSDFLASGDQPKTWDPMIRDATRVPVHRNNYFRAATDALASSYPAVHRIVGADFFDHMAGAFITRQPPTRRTLVGYGAEFPAFVSIWEAAAVLPYLSDVARLDRAFLEASSAADDKPLAVEAAAVLPFDDLVKLAPGLIGSARIIRTDWNVYDAWKVNLLDAPVTMGSVANKQDVVLLARPELTVAHVRIGSAEALFLERVGSGNTILDALEAAVAADGVVDPVQLVSNAFQTRIFKGTQ